MPDSVLRKRPAQVRAAPVRSEVRSEVGPAPILAPPITAPPPGTITGPLPPTPRVVGRSPFRAAIPRQRAKPMPRPNRSLRREPVPIGLIALALLFLGLFVVAMGIGAATNLDLTRGFGGSAANQPPPRAFPVLDPSRPERLSIPAINVQAPILEVGRAGDGSVAVPPLSRHDEAGWFGGGPTPGQFGPALIVGHADTRTGPSVFHDLPRLKPGQRIEVQRADRSVAVFEINSIERFNKGRLPLQRVYGDYSRPSLRLMTCGGEWLGGRTGYADNVVVFASLVSSRKA